MAKTTQLEKFYRNKQVLITGHTGFKGAWLSLMLHQLGAKITGVALKEDKLSLFNLLQIPKFINQHIECDIRNQTDIKNVIKMNNPEIVFHLAAQAFVREGYQYPYATYATNVMGTLNVLEALRDSSVKSIVVITTDKCYENKEWVWPYRENDALGGYDPYSSSKACTEILTASYRQSFFHSSIISTARAGNVIGGGDFSSDRLLPNIIRDIEKNRNTKLRYPNATRPWQHVFDVLYGYLLLAQLPYKKKPVGAFNFAPLENKSLTVTQLTEYFIDSLGKGSYTVQKDTSLHEAINLQLDASKAFNFLKWQPKYNVFEAITRVAHWYSVYLKKENVMSYSLKEMENYLTI